MQESVEKFETAHYRLFGLLSALTPEQWDGYVRAWVRGSTCGPIGPEDRATLDHHWDWLHFALIYLRRRWHYGATRRGNG